MKKILIVDDDMELLESLSVALKGSGYGVITAGSGDEGLAKARGEKPDLILLDVMMAHDTEGFETTQKIRRDTLTSKIPIIIITGIRKAKMLPFQFEPDEEWLPVSAVLEKPVNPAKLIEEIGKVLG